MLKYFDNGTMIVILITFILFVLALFVKGFTHDLLLEAAVFLVSVKLILMSYKTGSYHRELRDNILEIRKLLEKNQSL
jgi:hypothetical protein